MVSWAYVDQIQKAKGFLEELWRFDRITQDAFAWKGDSATHLLIHTEDGDWLCDCAYASFREGPCAHVRVLEQLLQNGLLVMSGGGRRFTHEPDRDEAARGVRRHTLEVA